MAFNEVIYKAAGAKIRPSIEAIDALCNSLQATRAYLIYLDSENARVLRLTEGQQAVHEALQPNFIELADSMVINESKIVEYNVAKDDFDLTLLIDTEE